MRTGIFPVLFLFFGVRLEAQFLVRAHLEWRTLETDHFAFHYPAELETWTQTIAARAEAIRSAVGGVVGYVPPEKTSFIVDDPYQTANGMAWPYLDKPLITLWASPPTPRDEIGEFRDWGEMLLTHEFAHIAHLTRPTRNSGLRALLDVLPAKIGPVALRAPRWAIEGYATFVEGRVTGTGRPHGVWRAAFLRQWSLEGQLPRYEQLNASAAYAGGTFAYLAGSAFLEWLADRHGDSSLVDVWRRLSARQNRTFDDAFAGVYGQSPAALYGRFSADLAGKSLDVARAVAGFAADTGDIVQRLSRSTGDPAISADGQRVALVVRSATLPSRVVIWRTAPEPDTLERRRDSLLLARDPQDVPARPIFPPPKRALATLRAAGGAPYESPRFLRDGRVLLWRPTARADGSLVNDLYIWDSAKKTVRRITHGASLRDPDPLPDGRSALAVRCLGGWCSLVRVDLTTGDVTTLLDGGANRSFYRPRVSPDGARAIVGVHHGGRWRLATIELGSNALGLIEPADSASRYDAAWLGPDVVVTTSERSGIASLERLDLRTLEARQLSRTTGAAVAAEPNRGDGSVWFLSLYSRGYEVRRLDGTRMAATAAPVVADAGLAPALSPPPTAVPAFRQNDVRPSRGFGLGPRLMRWIPQPSLDADGASAALAIVSRDVIGRSEIMLTGAIGDASAWRGGSVGLEWTGTRPGVSLRGFVASQRLSESRSGVSASALDKRLAGGGAAVGGTAAYDTWSARYRLGAAAAQLRALTPAAPPDDSLTTTRTLAFAEGALAWTQRGDRSSLTETLSGHVTLGTMSGVQFSRGVATASLTWSPRQLIPVTLSGAYGRTDRDAPVFERFALGGGPSLLLDRALLSQRIVMPVLPAGVAVGSSVIAYRGSLNTRPVALYLWSGSASTTDRFTAWHRVIGGEWSFSIPAIAAAGTPAARAVIGIGESLDAPFRKKVRLYASLVLNP